MIGDDPSFIEGLFRVPLRLLPGIGDPEISPRVQKSIVDLGPLLAYRLEAWVTKRTTVVNAPGEAAAPRLALAGSGAKAYESVVVNFVGAWESLLQFGPAGRHWREKNDASDAAQWAAFGASWQFLWQHLKNTAYLLALAVWNEDEIGAALYRDALIQWPRTVRHEIENSVHLREPCLLFPDILKLNWDAAIQHAQHILQDWVPSPHPDELFNSILLGAYDDVMLLTALLFLYWHINEKQVSNLSAQTAAKLLRREITDPELHAPAVTPYDRSFVQSFIEVLRLELAGEPFGEESYGNELDRLVATLDNMTERRVVPGRVYTPSTLHHREDLLLPMVSLLVAETPESGDGGVCARIENLAKNEDALPNSDRSLRNVLHQLRCFSTALESPVIQMKRGVLGVKVGCRRCDVKHFVTTSYHRRGCCHRD